ncbi:MAG: heme o synthase [Chloroflexi bacterium]|nr:heme o synthase [Chloroflexota bacterium]MCY4247105.1 heme o synthase [Chloroflexota bacterium]
MSRALSINIQPRAYIELTKPRIVALLVFTCLTSMIVAAETIPPVDSLLFTLLGGALAAGGSCAINQYLDRVMDAKMSRTARRPIPSGRISARRALGFGIALLALSALTLGLFVNWLAAGLALGGAFYYIVVYTVLLKRHTVANILIGGGAGAMPALVGWAAATGALELQAFILFAIIFYWTPPHSWALAILVNKDYAAADIPMMPVARGERVTRYQILFYSLQLVLISLTPGLLLLLGGAQTMLGGFYLLAAVILGSLLVWLALKLIRRADEGTARSLYKYSSLYLAMLFLAMIVDRLL